MRIAATFMLVSLLACFTAQAGDHPSLDELRAMASRDDPWAWKALGVMHDLNGEFDVSFTHFQHAANRGNGRSQQLLANAYRPWPWHQPELIHGGILVCLLFCHV